MNNTPDHSEHGFAMCANCHDPIQRCHPGCGWNHLRDGVFEKSCFPHTIAIPDACSVSDISRDAEVIHAEHHPGTFVPSLDSCPVHERAEYEQIARRIASLPAAAVPGRDATDGGEPK